MQLIMSSYNSKLDTNNTNFCNKTAMKEIKKTIYEKTKPQKA